MSPAKDGSAIRNSVNHHHHHRRPPPLKIHKDSRLIHKPTNLPVPCNDDHNQQRRRDPVVIYTHSPKVFRTKACDFMALVQKLTGMPKEDAQKEEDHNATDNRTSSDVLARPGHDAGREPPVECNKIAANAPTTASVGGKDWPDHLPPFPITDKNVMIMPQVPPLMNTVAPSDPCPSLPMMSFLPDVPPFAANQPDFTGGFSASQSAVDAMRTTYHDFN